MSTVSNSRYIQLSSSSQRKEVLWNVQQPGDPYDIRKSMIAKLPGGGTFMGDHIEIICLLQAAEIERLADFLEIYKFKFKDLERIELDRHSYEIQIKQLSQKIENLDTLRTQNEKLKDFIKKQGIQIEQLNQALRSKGNDQELKVRYEQILQVNQELKTENRILKSQLQGVEHKFKALETSKMIEIQEFKRKLSQKNIEETSYQKQDSELAIKNFKITVEGELRKLETEVHRLQELNELKSRDINLMKTDNQFLKEDIDRLTVQRDSLLSQTKMSHSADDSDTTRLRHEYESKIALLSSQLEHRNNVLRQKEFKYSELHHKNIEFEKIVLEHQINKKDLVGKLKNREQEITKLNQLIMKIDREGARASGHSQEQQIQYESKIRQLSQEIETLNSRLTMQVSHERQSKEQTERKSLENTSRLQSLVRENEQLKKGLLEATDLKRQLADLQSQRALLIQEVQRLNQLNNTKNSQLSHLKILSTQNDNLKSRISQIQRIWSSKYDSEISKITTEYQYKIKEISQIKGNELQSRVVLVEQQLDKTKIILKEKNNEAEKYKTSNFEWQSRYNQLELDQAHKFRNYETTLSTLKRENDELYTKIRLQNQLQLEVKEFKNKTLLMQSELQQVTSLLRSRQEENKRLQNNFSLDHDELEKKYHESNRKISQHAHKIVELTNENEELRRKINELISSNNNVSRQTVIQINRLSSNLRSSEEEKGKLEIKLRQITQELDYQKQKATGVIEDMEQLRRKLLQVENNNQTLLSQNSSSRNRLQIENDSLRRQINEFKVSITNYEAEITRRVNNYQSNIQALTRENEQLRKRFRQIELNLSQTDQKYKIKNEELITAENRLRNSSTQIENLKKYIKDYELQVNNKLDGEVSRKYQNYEQNIQKLSKEYEEIKRINSELERRLQELRRKNIDLERNYEDLKRRFTDNQNALEDMKRRLTESEHRYTALNAEYDKLNNALRSSTEDIEILKRQKIKKEGMISTYQSDLNKKIAEHENLIFNMTRSKEEMQRKINENDMALKLKYEELNRLEVNYRTINQELELSKRRYADLQNLFNQKMEGEVINKYKLYDKTIDELSKEGDKLRRKLAETSNQLNKKSVEINNLNPVLGQNQNLKKRIEKYDTSIAAYEAEVNRQFSSYEQKVDNLTKDNELLKKKLMEGTQATRKLSLQTEDKVLYLSRDLERINSKSQLLDKENGQLRKRLNQLGDLGRVVAELQNRLAITNQELERTNGNLRSKCDDFNKLENQHRNLQVDLQATRKKQTQYQSRISYTLENQIPKKYNSYEQTIMELKRKISETQNKNQNLSMQIERFNTNLRGKGEELTQVIANYQNLSNEYEQFKRRTKETETIHNQNIQNTRQENDELRRRLQEYDVNLKQFGHDSDRKIVEYENKTKIMIQQIQRLNQTISSKNDELEKYLRKVKEYQLTLNQRTELEMKNKVNSQNTLNALRRENDQLKRKLQEYGDVNQMVVEYSNKLNLTGQQFEKTSYILKQKTQDFSKLEISYRNLSRENQDLKRKIQELTDFNKRIIEYEQKINIIIQENDKLQHSLRIKTDQLNNAQARLRQFTNQLEQSKRHVIELEHSLTNKYQTEISRKTNSYEQNIMILSREREDLQRKRQDYQNKILNLSSEIQRLNGLVKTRTQELQRSILQTETFRQNSERKLQSERSTLQSNYNNVMIELEMSRKTIFEYEGKITQLNREFERLKAIIQQLEKSREELYAKNLILSEEIERLTYENKDLQTQTKDVRLRLSDESSLQKRINEHLSLMVILFAEIETLRNRVTAKQKEVETVRRSSLSPHMLKH